MFDAEVYEHYFQDGIKPDPILTVSEWADKYRILSQKSSAEAGIWRTSRTPFLKEIMDCLSVISPIEEVVFQKGSQVGGTECGNNWLGYIIDYAPGPIMAVQPTVELAKRNSKQRLAPLIEESERLSAKVKDPRSKDSGNTLLTKEFPGGVLVMTGANSAVGLRSLPARYIFLDEVDAYPGDVDGEGDPVVLARARARTFAKKKIFQLSTPTIEGRSRIDAAYKKTDQRRYFIPCARCGEYDWLKWRQIKWKKEDILNAWYECEHCNGKVQNWEKTKMLAAGEWRATNKSNNPRIAGFHLSSLYSPVGWVSWGQLAEEWEGAQDSREKLRGFINTVLGETWKDKGDAPDWKRLYERRQTYKTNSIPAEVAFLTAGVDIQKDRIEAEIVGWGRDKCSWSIDYRVFRGDTSNMSSDAWIELSSLVHETWEKNGIQMPIKLMAVDSGFNTQVVYSWVRQFPITKVIAVKGFDGMPVVIGQPKAVDVTHRGRKLRSGLKLFPVGVNIVKSELYGWLRLDAADVGEPDPHGFCRFPEYAEEYFKQLTAEELVIRMVKGYKRFEWQKIRDRNESLDCRVYARAAASVFGIDRFKTYHWDRLGEEIGLPSKKGNDTKKENKPRKVTIIKRKSSFW